MSAARALRAAAGGLAWLTVGTVAGCDPTLVDLGRAPPLDGGSAALTDGAQRGDGGAGDASPTADDLADGAAAGSRGEPPTLHLQVWGRQDVVQLRACTDDCVPVHLSIEGGVPPYRVRWDDGLGDVDRMLCTDPTRPRSVAVEDASDGRNPLATLALPPIDYAENGCGSGWTLCQRTTIEQDACGGESVRSWTVEPALQPGRSFVGSAQASAESAGSSYEVWVSDQPCGTTESAGSAYVSVVNPDQSFAPLQLGTIEPTAPWTHLVLTSTTSYGPLGPLGAPIVHAVPDTVRALQLCEHDVTGS